MPIKSGLKVASHHHQQHWMTGRGRLPGETTRPQPNVAQLRHLAEHIGQESTLASRRSAMGPTHRPSQRPAPSNQHKLQHISLNKLTSSQSSMTTNHHHHLTTDRGWLARPTVQSRPRRHPHGRPTPTSPNTRPRRLSSSQDPEPWGGRPPHPSTDPLTTQPLLISTH